jgi:dipeptidyl aminopeptidase/acylaminoacyl peptidase
MYQKKFNWFFALLVFLVCWNVLAAQEIFSGTDSPRFSPDGKQIVFSSTNVKKIGSSRELISGAIALINADGTNFRLVTQHTPGFHQLNASLSPDGKRIVFRQIPLADNPAGIEGDIFIVNVDGSNLKQLSNHKANEIFPEFSIDGKSVMFVREHFAGVYSPYQGELVSINLQDGSERILIAKEFRVKQAIPVPTGRGGILIACAEIENGKPLPKGSMLAVASPDGELDQRGFRTLPATGQKLYIDRIAAWFAPTDFTIYAAASKEDFEGESDAFKLTPNETKVLSGAWKNVRYNFSLSPDGKQYVTGVSNLPDTLQLREFDGISFSGKQTLIKIKK